MATASIATVVIGKPLVDLAVLGIEESEVTLQTIERFSLKFWLKSSSFPLSPNSARIGTTW